MEIRFLTQPNISFSRTLKEHLRNHETSLIAAAYLTADGIKEIEMDLRQQRSVKVVCDIHGCISDLHALKNLVLQSNKKIEGRVFLGTNVFHPKLYVFQKRDNATLLVGSPNLTRSDLNHNEEASIEITGSPSAKSIVDAIEYFEELWNTNSVSVSKFLDAHPNYVVRQSQNETLLSEQRKNLQSIKEELLSSETIFFKNRVNNTLLNDGKQTVLFHS